jgi:CheY-like chemotaxis protein
MEYEKKKILLADDNQSFLMYLGILLKRMGFKVMLAENGVEALRLIKLQQPDLVLLDCMMPVLDGVAVLRHVNAEQPAPFNIVMMSADPEPLRSASKFDCCGVLRKPVQIEELHEVLQNCIFRPMGFTRKHLRIPYNEKVSVTFDGVTQEFFAESLSEGGIYIRKKEPYAVSTRLEVAIPLQGTAPMTFGGRVIYVKGLFADLFRVSPGMAIEFVTVSPDAAATLRSYIKEYLAKDIWEEQEAIYIEQKD